VVDPPSLRVLAEIDGVTVYAADGVMTPGLTNCIVIRDADGQTTGCVEERYDLAAKPRMMAQGLPNGRAKVFMLFAPDVIEARVGDTRTKPQNGVVMTTVPTDKPLVIEAVSASGRRITQTLPPMEP
jgi:hypothetical protein